MAILDFLNKNTVGKEDAENPQTFTPKSNVSRGPGGKFVSKKKIVEEKKVIEEKKVEKKPSPKVSKDDIDKFYGPIMAPAAGKEIKKYYANKKWYFAIEDLIFLLAADPPIKPINELKVDSRFKSLFEKNVKTFNEVLVSDFKGVSEILRLVIKEYNATFPGSLLRWLEDISTHEFVKPQKEDEI